MPYLREALWQMGYAVDTLETATDWDNVENLLGLMEGSLREGLQAREESKDERTHVFTHLSHFTDRAAASTPRMFSVLQTATRKL